MLIGACAIIRLNMVLMMIRLINSQVEMSGDIFPKQERMSYTCEFLNKYLYLILFPVSMMCY